MYFIDLCHQEGIGVILDWTPAHFPSDAHGLAEFDGTHLYEHADPRQGRHPDWGTLVFNYGRTGSAEFPAGQSRSFGSTNITSTACASTRSPPCSTSTTRGARANGFPTNSAGARIWRRSPFLKRLNEVIYAHYPGVLMIAEESTAWPAVSRPTYAGGLGFNLKWNMGWMNDTLQYFSLDPIYRKFNHSA